MKCSIVSLKLNASRERAWEKCDTWSYLLLMQRIALKMAFPPLGRRAKRYSLSLSVAQFDWPKGKPCFHMSNSHVQLFLFRVLEAWIVHLLIDRVSLIKHKQSWKGLCADWLTNSGKLFVVFYSSIACLLVCKWEETKSSKAVLEQKFSKSSLYWKSLKDSFCGRWVLFVFNCIPV